MECNERNHGPSNWPVVLVLAAAVVFAVVTLPAIRRGLSAGRPEEWREQDAGEALVKEVEWSRRKLRESLERMEPAERRRVEEAMRQLGIREGER